MTRKPKAEGSESDIPDIRRSRPEIPLNCGQCLYLHRYSTYALPCDQYGSTSTSTPCNRFVADPGLLGDAAGVRDLLQAVGRSQSPAVVTAILLQSRRCRKHGRRVGEVVFFRAMGEDYLCNYASGVVTGADREAVIVMGAAGFVARLQPKEIMGSEEWQIRHDSLIGRNRINDPSGGLRRISLRGKNRLVHYVPPEMRAAKGRAKSKGPRSTFSGRRKGVRTVVLSSGGSQ